MDFRNGFVRLCYNPDFVCATSWNGHLAPYREIEKSPLCRQDKMKPGYLTTLPEVLKQLSVFLGDNKWFAGDKVQRVLNGCSVIFISYILFSGFNGGLDPECHSCQCCWDNWMVTLCPPDRSHLWTSSCTSCWTSTGCFSLPASMTSRTSKISWTDLR